MEVMSSSRRLNVSRREQLLFGTGHPFGICPFGAIHPVESSSRYLNAWRSALFLLLVSQEQQVFGVCLLRNGSDGSDVL